MNTLRGRLTLWLLSGCAVAFALAGGILRTSVGTALQAEFDAGLEGKARALRGFVEREGPLVEFDDPSEAMPEYAGGASAEYFTLWLSSRPDSRRSASLGADELPRRAGPLGGPPLAWDLDLPDGRPGRALGITVPLLDESGDDGDPEDDENSEVDDEDDVLALDDPAEEMLLTVVVARGRDDLAGRMAAVDSGLVLGGLSALLLVWLAVRLGVSGGLRPLRRVADEVGALDAKRLDRRVEASDVPDEVRPVVTRLNALLEDLEGSFAKERRMTAAMAHELRTPIAELRSASDVARRWPDDVELATQAAETAADVARRMGGAVDAILRYCRMEAGQARAEWEDVPLRELVEETWRPCAPRARRRCLDLVVEVAPHSTVRSDRGLLGLVLANLLDNAASFASESPILVSESGSDPLTLEVSNPSRDLSADDLPHLAEPFWRKDAARAGEPHSGLGLALVEAITVLLGHRLTFHLEGDRFVARVTLPRVPAVRPGRGLPRARLEAPGPRL